MAFHRSLCDSKSPQVSRTLLSILAVLNNVVVWMVSTRPPTSKSSSPFYNPLVTVQNSPITIGIVVTWMFHSFFYSLARSRYFCLVQDIFFLWNPVRLLMSKMPFCAGYWEIRNILHWNLFIRSEIFSWVSKVFTWSRKDLKNCQSSFYFQMLQWCWKIWFMFYILTFIRV